MADAPVEGHIDKKDEGESNFFEFLYLLREGIIFRKPITQFGPQIYNPFLVLLAIWSKFDIKI